MLFRSVSQSRYSKTIEKYIPLFINALTGIMKNIPELKSIKAKDLEAKLQEGLAGKYDHLNAQEDEEAQEESEPVDAESEAEEEGDLEGDDEDRPKRIPKEKLDEEEGEESKPEPIQDDTSLEEKAEVQSPSVESKPVPPEEAKKEPLVETGVKIKKKSTKKVDVLEVPSGPIKAPESSRKVEETPKVEVKSNEAKAADVKSPPSSVGPTSSSGGTSSQSTQSNLPSTPSKSSEVISIHERLAQKKSTTSPPAGVLDTAPTPAPSTLPVTGGSKKSSEGTGSTKSPLKKESHVPVKSGEKPSKISEKEPQKSPPSTSKATQTQLPVTKPQSTPAPTPSPAASKPQTTLPSSGSPAESLKKPVAQIKLPTTEEIIAVFKPNEWLNLRDILARLNISDMTIARFVQVKLSKLQGEKRLVIQIQTGKQVWKLT